jgi:hypothetical protein
MTKILSNKSNIDLDYPICRPSLDLDFTQEVLDPRITFSRGTVGTRVNRNRLIETVSANLPRFDFDPVTGECRGLLIEDTRNNLLKYSNDFSTGGAGNWTPVSATCVFTRNVTGPDGVANSAWTIDDQSTSADGAGFEQTFGITTPSTTTNYCLSIFVKQGTATFFDFYAFFTGNSTKGSFLRYTFSTDTITVLSADGGGITPTIYGKISYPNGWIRIYFVVSDANNGLNNILQYRIYPASRNINRIGNTLFYGAQLEAGAFPTSYIPTTASTVTRSADNVEMTGTNFSSWYNSTEGTLCAAARVNALGGSGFPGIAYVDDGTVNNSMRFYVNDAVSDRIGVESYLSGRAQYGFASSSAIIPNQLNKVISSYSINNFAGAFSNMNYIQRDINGSIPTVNRLILGDLRGANAKLNGTIARFTYYPRKLKDNQLLYLTQ